jgi:polysaccharide deacetylase 2 family uncharacterized protein YibQ
MTAPSKPAEATADAAATAPDAPAGTQIAVAEPEPVAPPVEPEPVEPAAEPEATEAAPDQSTTETPESAPAVASETASSAITTEADAAPAEEVVVAEAAPAATVEPASEPVPEATREAVPEAAPTEETVVAEAAPEPDVPAADVTEAAPEAAAPEPVPEPTPEVMPAPETAEADMPAAETPGEAVPDMPGARPDALPGEAEAQDPSAATDDKGSTFKPAPGLPRAGESGDEAPAEPAAEPAADPVDPRPIVQFAASFENPDAKPPFAIVLIDDGNAALDRAALAALPFPVSFALNPLDPASAQHAATYRAAGKEVVMLVTGIAEGAMPADVEVAFQSMEQGLVEAVAVMDLPEPSFQNRRPLAATVVPILKAQGRGLLTWDAGLNAADQVARREDLEAGVIFRDLGSAGGDSAAMRRLLDRAVFKAGQEGRVSVVGTADPATVAAILEWTVEGKAATVALAPVTAVLTVE